MKDLTWWLQCLIGRTDALTSHIPGVAWPYEAGPTQKMLSSQLSTFTPCFVICTVCNGQTGLQSASVALIEISVTLQAVWNRLKDFYAGCLEPAKRGLCDY